MEAIKSCPWQSESGKVDSLDLMKHAALWSITGNIKLVPYHLIKTLQLGSRLGKILSKGTRSSMELKWLDQQEKVPG